MITLHHLNDSRSFRVHWLLLEAKIPHQVIYYQRDAVTQLAPESLKKVHPLGKSPVIELDGQIISESGAIIELLIERFAPDLRPPAGSPQYAEYYEWIHFAESSAMVPVLLRLFNSFETAAGTELRWTENYANNEFNKVFSYVNQQLSGRRYITGEQLTGADFMIGWVLLLLHKRGMIDGLYPAIDTYLQTLSALPSLQQAQALDAGPVGG